MKRILLVVLAAAGGGIAHAQRTLALDDALAMARAQNRDLQAARARLDQARVAVEQAWQPLLPTVSAQGKYTHNYKEVTLSFAEQSAALFGLADVIKATSGNPTLNGALNDYEMQVIARAGGGAPIVIQKAEQLDFALTATIPLLVPSAYGALSAARKTYAAAESNYAVTEAQLLYTTAQAFFTAAGADELENARKHAIQVAQKTVDDARARLAAGVVNRVEVARAELALVRAQQAAREAGDATANAYRALATILLLREPFRVVPAEVNVQAEAPETLVKQALTLRPEITALDRNVVASDATVSSAWWRYAPTLSAFGNVRAFNYPGFSGDNYSWALGLQLDWLLYDAGARDSARHLAQAQRRESSLRLSQLRDTIADDLYVSRRALDTKRAALETAVRSVELSRETLDLVRVQHEAGTATQLDLLQAQDNLVAAEVAVAQARFDLALADLALRRTAGTFPTR
jgi:outer membrane protein TolC